MKEERRRKIIEILRQERTVTTGRICELTKASLNTIRSDFASLEKEGKLVRFYGGITLPDAPIEVVPSKEREHRNPEQKQKIAKTASSLVEDRDVIYLDDGTTTSSIVASLDPSYHLTVITPSILVVNEILNKNFPNITTICLGGQLDITSRSCLGSTVIESISHYNFAKIFMSCTAISLSSGATEGAPLEAEKKRVLMKSTARKIMIADDSKFDYAAAITFAQLKEFDTIITNKKLNDTYLNYLHNNKVDLIIV